MTEPLSPELLLKAYQLGVFPMAKSREDEAFLWVQPKERGVIPLDHFHVPKSLQKFLKKNPYEIRFNTAFEQVIDACAAPRKREQDSWINPEIRNAYIALNKLGFAHSVECWGTRASNDDEVSKPSEPSASEASLHVDVSKHQREQSKNPTLLGGLYGVALGGAFFGESMFSHADNASKVALVSLVARLRANGFMLLDAQFTTKHLAQFGTLSLPHDAYMMLLNAALRKDVKF